MDPIVDIAPSPVAVEALGTWPQPAPELTARVVPAPPPPSRRWIPGMCENRALIYKPNPKAYGGKELDRIKPCYEPATVDRWSRRGTDQAELRHFCQAHDDSHAAFVQRLTDAIDRAYAERGEDPIDHHIGDHVLTPDGPGTVVYLPSAAWSATYSVGLDSRRRGDRPSQYRADQLQGEAATDTVQLPVQLQNGDVETWEFQPTSTPGLLVNEVPLCRRNPAGGAHWRLSHHTGRALAAFHARRDALTAASSIADLSDWTRSAADLATDPSIDRRELFARVLQADGTPMYHRTTPVAPSA